jgi:hypothetical protein
VKSDKWVVPPPGAVEIVLTDTERAQREAWARRPKTGQRFALRSRIALGAADGANNALSRPGFDGDGGLAWFSGVALLDSSAAVVVR